MGRPHQETQPDMSQTPRLPVPGRVLLWIGLAMLLSPAVPVLIAVLQVHGGYVDSWLLAKATFVLCPAGLALMYATVAVSDFFRKRSAHRVKEQGS
jgi:hypothetical protein